MLTQFDWLRRCRSGAELLSTLEYFAANPNHVVSDAMPGPPFSASQGPCLRCQIYAPEIRENKRKRFCKFCREILTRAKNLSYRSTESMVMWGYVNQVPRVIHECRKSSYVYGAYIHDTQRFLVVVHRRHLRILFQELVMYHGMDLKGLIQIFPTSGVCRNLNMGDYLTWAIHHEANLLHDQLWIRFFDTIQQLINPKKQEQLGLLTFSIAEFLRVLEMAEVFRANLRRDEQKNLLELLKLDDPKEEQFYWGRFLGQLNQEARDMLSAWRIRQWPKKQINFLYTIINYVVLPKSS